MKKSLFLAALATIALASCTQNEDFSQPEKINFNPLNYKAQSTKAPINGAYYTSSDPSFGIFAFHTDKGWDDDGTTINEYIPKSKVSWNETNSEWNTATNAYWPLSGSLTFIGYTPFTSGNADVNAAYDKATKELTITNFSAANQDDLMYTLPSDAQDLTVNSAPYIQEQGGTSAYSGVPIKFRHALSQIVVTAKVADTYTGATFTINSISLQGMNDNATLTVTESPSPVASWGETSAAASFTIPNVETAALGITATPVGKPVLVIPQALKVKSDIEPKPQQLEINYSMTVDLGTPNDKSDDVTTTTTKYVDLNSGANDALTALAMGKKYTLNLTISADKILYSPSVDEWYPGDDDDDKDDYQEDYDVPGQPAAGN